MSRFNIVLGKLGQGYRVDIIGDDGARQTVLGFSSEDEASRWISVEKQRERFQQQTTRLLDAAD